MKFICDLYHYNKNELHVQRIKTYENLEDFLIKNDDRVPYTGKITDDNGIISWELSYNGCYGLGYTTTFIYNQTNKKWRVVAANDGTVDCAEYNGIRVLNIPKSHESFIGVKFDIIKLTSERIVLESDDISDIIVYGCYYGLDKPMWTSPRMYEDEAGNMREYGGD